jgi:hypothetical protein
MISLVKELPEINSLVAEWIKIKCLFDSYQNDDKVLFWCQDKDKAIISMTDGNMIILNNGADVEELREFCDMLSPACVFSDYDTLTSIGRKPKERINIMYRKADIKSEKESDFLKSDEIYRLLDTEGLSLPEYEYFAVDYCRRLNLGFADYFAIKDKCAAVSFKTGNLSIMNGIASREKGYGSIALRGILSKNYGNEFLVCCRDKVKIFYEKNGFEPLYFGGYWVKNI